MEKLFLLLFVILVASGMTLPEEPEDLDYVVGVPIPDRSQIKLAQKFCLNFSCLSELRDPVEKDKVFMANLVYTYV